MKTYQILPDVCDQPRVSRVNMEDRIQRLAKWGSITSRNLRDRLYRELKRNLAMKVEDGETADTFLVSVRGTLHLTILIENMRRENFEFMVGPPKVINKRVDDKLLEPYEIATVEVPEEHTGSVVELLGRRRGQMFDMQGLGLYKMVCELDETDLDTYIPMALLPQDAGVELKRLLFMASMLDVLCDCREIA